MASVLKSMNRQGVTGVIIGTERQRLCLASEMAQGEGMKRILVVEDNVPFRESLKDVLRAHFSGVEIVEAGNGQEACRRMTSPTPDVVLMDIGLPGENGLRLTRRIKDQYPQVTVIILTNCDQQEYREAAGMCGADRYFLKDALANGLISAIASSLGEAPP